MGEVLWGARSKGGDDMSELRYEQRDIFGVKMKSLPVPYKKVINNGCIIQSQDDELIKILDNNEVQQGRVIDWWLFKPGRTVLYAPNGKIYGCSEVYHNYIIVLNEIIDTEFLKV